MSARAGHPVVKLIAWLAVALGCALLVSWWSAGDVAAQDDEIGDVELGAQLYAQACAQCHASDGGGACRCIAAGRMRYSQERSFWPRGAVNGEPESCSA